MLDKAENARLSVNTMIEPVAEALGNTVAMSRKAYVHPALIAAVKDNPRDPLKGLERPRSRKWLSSCEVALIPFLKKVARKAKQAAA
jgi:DNA topoisomerase I